MQWSSFGLMVKAVLAEMSLSIWWHRERQQIKINIKVVSMNGGKWCQNSQKNLQCRMFVTAADRKDAA